MITMNIRINKTVILYLLLFIPFFKPVGFADYIGMDSIHLLWKLASLFIGILIILCKSNREIIVYQKDFWLCGLLIFFLIYFVNCLSVPGILTSTISNIVQAIELVMIPSMVKDREERENMCYALDVIFFMLLFFQIISVFYIKSGRVVFDYIENDYIYFLGTDNYSAFATIPMLGSVLYFEYENYSVISMMKRIFLCLGLCLSYIYTGAVSAAIVSVFLVIIYCIAKCNRMFLRYFTINKIIVLCVLILYLIIKFNIQNYMLGMLTLVGKSAKATTLNSRTIIWGMALDIIKQNFLFGVGEFTTEQVNNYVLYGMNHAHNLLLDLMLKTGTVGATAYLCFYSGFLSKYLNSAMKSRGFILVIALIGYFMLSMMDDYPFVPYIYCCVGLLWGNCKYEE